MGALGVEPFVLTVVGATKSLRTGTLPLALRSSAPDHSTLSNVAADGESLTVHLREPKMSTGAVDTPTTDYNPYTSPTDQDGHPLSWDGNDGRILGLVHELGLHTVRHAILQTFIKKRARVLSNGLMVAESIPVVPLVMGTVAEPDRTLDTMCPPGPERFAEVNAWRATPAGGGEAPLVPITAMPATAADIIRISANN